MTEVSVLHDVLAIAREKKFRYMVLDPVEQDSTDTKLSTLVLAKKKVNSVKLKVFSDHFLLKIFSFQNPAEKIMYNSIGRSQTCLHQKITKRKI